MTDPQRPQHSPSAGDTAELTPDEARLVSRIEEHYRAPERPPEARVAFQEALDARLERDRGGFGWVGALASVAAVCVLAWGVFSLLAAPPDSEELTTIARSVPTHAASLEDVTPEEALLALSEDASDAIDTLPDDYEAIASLFLGDA